MDLSPGPTLGIVAGPNGSGKTSFYDQFLKQRFPLWVNADEIALTLTEPSDPKRNLAAARLRREFFPSQTKSPAQGSGAWHPAQRSELLGSRRLRVGIAHGRSRNLFVGHGPEPIPVRLAFQRLRGAVRQYLNDAFVTAPFGYDNIRFAHPLLLSVAR